MPHKAHSTPRPPSAYLVQSQPYVRHDSRDKDTMEAARNAVTYPQKRHPQKISKDTTYGDYVAKCKNNIEAEIWAFAETQLKDFQKLDIFTVSINEESPGNKVTVLEINERPADMPPETYNKLEDFHNTACICLRRMGLFQWNDSKKVLSIQLGCEIGGVSIPDKPRKKIKSPGKFTFHCQVRLMGFVGSYIKDMKATLLALEVTYTLLSSIADSNRRVYFNYLKPDITTETPTPIKINEQQLECLRNLEKNVEGIQGPPGTGKSTTIFHLINSFVPSGYLAVVTCVQNKAVESIAEKLANHIPFVVFGNEDRLGETAKGYLLDNQVDRHEDVISQNRLVDERKSEFQEASKAYNGTVKEVKKLGKRAGLPHEEDMDSLLTKMKGLNIANSTILQEKLHAAITKKTQADIAYNSAQTELTQIKGRVELDIARDARAVLCTIDSTCNLFPGDLEPIYGLKPKIAIIDEAGTVPDYKSPLLAELGCEAIVCIGDQKQLYPFSHCDDNKQGLFHRLAGSINIPMLNEQYRMHPDICEYVSKTFYSGTLKTFSGLSRDGGGLTWVPHSKDEVRERPSGYKNLEEVRLIFEQLRSVPMSQSVMVLTFYKKQLYAINAAAKEQGVDTRSNLRITTVDASQGSEADVVIISCVRSNRRADIGFLKDSNRLCVATSRARYRLIAP